MLENDSEPQALGGLLLARIAYLRKIGGTPLVDHVFASLAPGDAAILRDRLQPDAWYPLALHLRVDEAIASAISPDDRATVLIHLGRASADTILASRHRSYIKEGAPEFFLEAVPLLYSALHSGGYREYTRLHSNTAVIKTFERKPLVPPDNCWTVLGLLQRGLELSGAAAVLVTETSCRAAGAACCEYRCEWSS